MKATKQLPAHYEQQERLDFSLDQPSERFRQDSPLLLMLNMAGLLLFVLFCYLFRLASTWLRSPNEPLFSFTLSLTSGLLWLLTILACFVAVITLHELVHGLFFWLFTKEKPHFGFKIAYAYAAAPKWYIPRNQFIIIGAAPLVILTLAGVALIPTVPNWLLPGLLFSLAFNASGAVGDLYIIWWLLRKPSNVLVQDVGDAFTIYGYRPPPR
ncbi:MAG: DUF3267 domain-containing protein [Ardenticatenaceae bacterium]